MLALLVMVAVQAMTPAAAPSIKVLMRTGLSGDEAREVIVATAEFAPGATTGRHTHPGDEYATLLEGELELLVEGQPAKRVRAGEAYHNARDIVHETRNGGQGIARVVSTFVIDKGKPVMVPVR